MGFIQLFTSLWPFLKEMIIGEKIKDSAPSKEGASDSSPEKKRGKAPTLAAHWVIDKMQKSRRFLAFVMVMLITSLFINYKAISKLSAVVPPRNEEVTVVDISPTTDPLPLPTVPGKILPERDDVYEQTLKELKFLYGSKT